MSEYITKSGDTFAIIARQVYGSEEDVGLIRSANPGVTEPLPASISIVVPDLAPETGIAQVDDPDGVTILIGGKVFKFWTTYRLVRSLTSFTVVEFSAPFDPGNEDQRELFKPFAFNTVSVSVGDEVIFTGFMLPPIPAQDEDSITVTVAAYSKASVLNDCTFSGDDFEKFSLSNRNLQEIAKSLCGTLALTPVFLDDPGANFEEVTIEPDENALQFLMKMAKQRNLVITDNEEGEPVFLKSIDPIEPVAILDGNSPEISITPQFNGQGYFSHITAISPADTGSDGGKFTVKNSRLKTVIRPHNFKAQDTDGADVKTAAQAKMGRMFANSVNYTVPVLTWRDSNGDLWKPNTYINLFAPGVMIYSEYSFLLKDVEFSKDPDSKTAVLTLVLPGAFSGEIPELLPWE